EKDRNNRPGSYDDIARALALSHAEILVRFAPGDSPSTADRHTASTVKFAASSDTQAETLGDPLGRESQPPENPKG
ncbi:MAG: hypothetical protein ACRD1B_02455, partial [Thermoanaerobaculia bacterium]